MVGSWLISVPSKRKLALTKYTIGPPERSQSTCADARTGAGVTGTEICAFALAEKNSAVQINTAVDN